MTDAEVESLVLETVRRYTTNEAAGIGSRFGADLRLSDAARQMLFASMAQAFAARGWSLPSHGFFQGDFLACATPAEVRDAIRQKVFGAATAKKARTAGAVTQPATPPAIREKPPRTTAKPRAKAKPGGKRPASRKPSPSKGTRPARKRR